MNQPQKLQLCLFGFVTLLFFFGSSALPFLGPDEPRYSQVARQMFETGDIITPYLGTFHWFEKPILLYWLMALSYKLWGVNEFGARFPSFLAALGTVGAVYLTVRSASNYIKALVAALILGTSAFLIGFAHAATFDMLLTFFVTTGLCSFTLYQLDPSRKRYLHGLYVCAGLGILAKGFVAIILIGLPILLYLLLNRKLTQLPRMNIPAGSLIVLLVTALWFVPVSLIWGLRFWDEFFYQHQILRYTSSTFHRSGGAFYYVPVLLLGTFPWTTVPFLQFRMNLIEREKVLHRISLCWFFAIVFFFSFSRSKLPGYVMPAVPAFAVFAAIALVEYFTGNRSHKRLVFLVAGTNLLFVIAVFVALRSQPIPVEQSAGICIGILLLTLVAITLACQGRKIAAACAYSLIPLASIVFVVAMMAPKLHWNESRDLSLAAKPHLTGNRLLIVYNVYDFSPLFYTNARVKLTTDGYLYTLTNDSQLYRYVRREKEAFVLMDNQEWSWITRVKTWRVTKIVQGSEKSVVLLTTK